MASGHFKESDCIGKESWKIALNNSRVYICEHIFQLLEVLNKVDSTCALSVESRQAIKGGPGSTTYEQNDRLVDWLLTRTEVTFNIFLEALRDTNNSHIADNIKTEFDKTIQSISSGKENTNNEDSLVPSKEKGTNQIGVSQNSSPNTAIFDENSNLPSSSKCSAMEKRKIIFPFDEEGKAEERRRELILLHESVRLRINNAKKQSNLSHKMGFIVVSGGTRTSGAGYLSNCHIYDIESNMWDTYIQIPNTPGVMWNHSLVNLDGLLCTVGGLDQNEESIMELQILSIAESKWISYHPMQNIPIVGAVYKQPGIIAMGRSADDNTKIIQMGLNFAWKDIVELKGYHWSNVASLNEKIYCLKGTTNDGDKVYDPAKKSWSNISRSTFFAKLRTGFKAIALQGCIVLIGTDELGACEKYNPDNNKIEYLTSLPEPLERAAVATDGKRIFVIGGVSEDGVSDTLQIYDYEGKKWRKGAPCPSKLSFAAAAFVEADVLLC